MGCIIDSCEYSSGLSLDRPVCFSAKAIFIVNIIFLIKVLQQIFLYHKKKDRFHTRKLVLFYLLMTEITANMIYSGIRSWIQLYLIDIVLRHLVFLYLIYYFGRKLTNLMESPTRIQKKSPKILAIVGSLYFFALLIYGFVESSRSRVHNTCFDNYWMYLRVGGLITMFIFIILGVFLINRHKENYETNADFTMIIKYSIGNPYSEVEKSLIEKNIENMLIQDEKNYNIWLIMGIHFFSAVLTLTTTIYLAITSNSAAKICGYYPFDSALTEDRTLLTILGWALSLINYFLPLIIILKVFNYKEIRIDVKKDPSVSEEDEFPYHENLRVQAKDQSLNKMISSKSSSMILDFEDSSKKSFEERKSFKGEFEEEEEKKDWKEETRSSGFL